MLVLPDAGACHSAAEAAGTAAAVLDMLCAAAADRHRKPWPVAIVVRRAPSCCCPSSPTRRSRLMRSCRPTCPAAAFDMDPPRRGGLSRVH